MDGRMQNWAGISAGILMTVFAVLPMAARGQAMGKAAVDATGLSLPAEPASPVVSPAAGESALPASVVREAPAAATPDMKLQNVTSWPSMQLVTIPAGALSEASAAEAKVDAPAKTSDVKEPVAPVVDGLPKSESVKPVTSAIENAPIRQSAAETPAAAAGNGQKTGTELPSGWKNFVQVGAALAIVIGLIFVLKAAARKFVPGAKAAGGKGVIEILARHPLTKNQSIVLVRIGSQIVALNQGKDASESVLVISDGEEVARIIGQIEGKNPNSASAGFNRLLANARVDLEQSSPADDAEDGKAMGAENLDEQLEEMAAAKRQLMELRQHVRTVRDSLPQT